MVWFKLLPIIDQISYRALIKASQNVQKGDIFKNLESTKSYQYVLSAYVSSLKTQKDKVYELDLFLAFYS